MITIVDYQMGNPASIRNMLRKAGVGATITSDPVQISRASKLILGGVGAFDAGMSNIERLGLVKPLNEAVCERGVPILGICLGMQLMTRSSEEGARPGLGWVAAHTVRFDQGRHPGLRVPHMGWNLVVPARSSPLIEALGDEPRFYFVHGYYVACEDRSDVLLSCTYADPFDAAFARGSIYGVQFHPEKSHRYGMALLRNFAERVDRC